jgi:hypothetical protein
VDWLPSTGEKSEGLISGGNISSNGSLPVNIPNRVVSFNEYSENIEMDGDKEVTLNVSLIMRAMEPLDDQVSYQHQFEDAVDKLDLIRSVKASVLRGLSKSMHRDKDESLLDQLDNQEAKACGRLYGIFKYTIGCSDVPSDEVPDKNYADEVMEARFGSLDREGHFGEDDLEDAAATFSCYLSRKMWVPVPWRKFSQAVDSFKKRVVYSPIERPVDKRAVHVAERIFDLIIYEGKNIIDTSPFKDFEPCPPSSCIEADRGDGGKRELGSTCVQRRYVSLGMGPPQRPIHKCQR